MGAGSMTDYSRRDMAYACRLANRGYDETMIFRALAQKPSGRRDPGSVKYQRILDERGRDRADAYAHRTAEKALAFVKANPAIKDRASALVALYELEGIAGTLPWAVYGGPGARRALEAAFVVAERVGGLSFGLALRQWAEESGRTRRATQSSRDLLVRLGWLHRNPDDRLGRTARYRLRTPPYIHSHGRSECTGSFPRVHLAHDAFREEALGDVGWYVLSSICNSESRVTDLSVRTGLGLQELTPLLKAMEGHGLVYVDDGIVIRANEPGPSLGGVAARYGTTGHGETDKKTHLAERQSFRRDRGVNVREGRRD